MHTKNYVFLFLASLLVWNLGCAEKEEIDPNLTFTLLVENSLPRSVDVYIKPQAEIEEPFVLEATAISGQTIEIPELVIREAYRIRFVNQGRPLSEFFEERAIANLDEIQAELLLVISG